MPDLLTIQTVDRCLLISIQQSRPLAVVQELEWVAIELTLPDPHDFSMSILKDRQPEGYVLKGPSPYRCTWTVFLTGQDMKNTIFCYSVSVRSLSAAYGNAGRSWNYYSLPLGTHRPASQQAQLRNEDRKLLFRR